MKKFNVIMNGTPLNDYEMDEIFGGDTNINCQNTVQSCCVSNHSSNCGTNPSGCVSLNKVCDLNPCYIPVNSAKPCEWIANNIVTCINL